MPDRSLGQAAYEKWVIMSGHPDRKLPWDQLRPPVRARWELIAAAVLEECGGSDG
jgi:hypothetical protein